MSTKNGDFCRFSCFFVFFLFFYHNPNIYQYRDPFVKFAKDHVKLRVLTGIMAGQVGYVVRILKNRQLVMDFGGYAVAINDVHNEDFEIAE